MMAAAAPAVDVDGHEVIPGTNIRVTRASKLVQDYLTTGSKVLDKFLYGGIPTFGVTEIVGEAGAAKTQFCLQLALHAQLPKSEGGLASEAIYISTEDRFPSKRLVELSEHFIAKYRKHLGKARPMDKIRLEHISDSASLMNCLQTRIPKLIEDENLKPRLIIVDSVAVLFRFDCGIEDIKKRTQDLRHVGVTLHKLGRKLNAAIVVVNQVSGQIGDDEDPDPGNVPALGMAWKNCVTTRILLSREFDASPLPHPSASEFVGSVRAGVQQMTLGTEELEALGDSDGESRVKRSLSIKFAPHVPNRTIPIQLNQEGIKAGPNVLETLLYQPSDGSSDSES